MRMYPHGSGMFRQGRLCRLSSCGYLPDYLLSLSVVKTKSMENKEMDTCKLLYNTERVKLYIPEYGRNVQKMVDKIKTIEDREKRNEQARAVIKVMEILNPSVRILENYEHKLWDHLYIIAGFDLDVDAPYPMPAPESINETPRPIPLDKKPLKAAHYGRNIENMLNLVASHEEGDAKVAMIRSLAGYMKQQYLIWNKDTVADETIYKDIEILSDGKIVVPDALKEGKLEINHNHQRQNGGGQNKKNGNFKQKNNQKNRKQHK